MSLKSQYLQDNAELAQAVFDASFTRYDGYLASGKIANNKFKIESIREKPELKAAVVQSLGTMIVARQVDFVTSVPDGANWLGRDVSEEFGLENVRLQRSPSNLLDFEFKSPHDRRVAWSKADAGKKGAVIEDVFTTMGSTSKVVEIADFGDSLKFAAAVWDRGSDENRLPLEIPHDALIKIPIDPMLPENSPIWHGQLQ